MIKWSRGYVVTAVSSAISCLSQLDAAMTAMVILEQPLTLVLVCRILNGLAATAVVPARHVEAVESQFE